MWAIILLLIIFTSLLIDVANSTDINNNKLPLSCPSPIYCHGKLLETVQMASIFDDSKTFVDLHLIYSQNETLKMFNKMMDKSNNKPTKDQIEEFVKKHFGYQDELKQVELIDFKDMPEIFKRINDYTLKRLAISLHKLWPVLARKVIQDVHDHPEKHSIEPLPHPFVVPGGRFREPYYWDTYWIIKGLLISDMPITARNMIDNFCWLVNKHGFVPNGARVYYLNRSQPPLLTAMIVKYVEYTKDYKWLKENLECIEKELTYWLNRHAQDVDGYTMLRYYAPSQGPRPESYREDIETANGDSNKYIQLKSAAESGWDFSARWFWTSDHTYSLKLDDIDTTNIIPVDLNAYFCGAIENLIRFYLHFRDVKKGMKWEKIRNQFREAIYHKLWNDEEGVWFDYHFVAKKQRKEYFASNVAPLWTQCLTDKQNITDIGDKIVDYLERNGVLKFPGGIPTSLNNTGEQWDFPNAWPPLQTIVIEALELSGSQIGREMAFKLTEKWVKSNLIGYRKTKSMFEKYDTENVGQRGGGGEYYVQKGFGWTNGAILDMINKYAVYSQSEDQVKYNNMLGVLRITMNLLKLFVFYFIVCFVVILSSIYFIDLMYYK